MPNISSTAAREVVHLLLLGELQALRGGTPPVLKGGVNLRLFFGSMRYSEDIDLDSPPETRAAVRSCIRRFIEEQAVTPKLRELGLRGLDPGSGVNKDTETTFRYKFGVVGTGQLRHATKVEVSFRGMNETDPVVEEIPHGALFERYGLAPFPIRHYTRQAAIRQKIEALAGRTEVQARDVFDLRVLTANESRPQMAVTMASLIDEDKLRRAYDRALDLSFSEFQGQVAEFLEEETRGEMGTADSWDEARLMAADFIDAILESGS